MSSKGVHYKECAASIQEGVGVYVGRIISAYLDTRHIHWLIMYNMYP